MIASTAHAPSVLIIDDSAQIRAALVRELMRLRVAAVAVATPVEAFIIVERRPSIRLVIVDWHLETADGRDVLRCLADEHPALRFVLMSGAELPTNLFRAMENGPADGLLSKPWDASSLAYVVDAGLHRRRT